MGERGSGKSALTNATYSLLSKRDAGIRWAIEPKTYTPPNRIEMIIDEKKQRFLNIPNISFHSADLTRLRDYYNDYFKEPTIESLLSEVTGETSGEIKGSLPKIIEAGVGSKDISKWVSNIKIPDISLTGMFLRYQRETINKGQVILYYFRK